MTPTAPAFDLEVRTPVPGVFVLDHSELDGPDLLATDPDAGFTWVSIKCDATRIETWRGAHLDGVAVTVDVGTLSVDTLIDPATIGEEDLQTGALIRLRTTGSTPETLATMTIDNAVVTENKLEDHAHLQLTATDAVSSLANTIRYGAANPTAEGEPWPARVTRLMSSANVPTAPPEAIPHRVTLEDTHAALEVGKWTGSPWEWSPTGYQKKFDGIATRQLTGLTPGLVYRISITVNAGAVPQQDKFPEIWLGNGWDDYEESADLVYMSSVRFSEYYADFPDEATLLFEFTARTPTETLTLAGEPIAITRLQLLEYPRVTWAANIVTETNLARHLDIAATTAGRGWYVDRHGITRIATTTGPILAHLSDTHDPHDPLHVCYTHITPAWGTEDVVNDLQIENITRRRNEDDSGWEDARTALGPYRDKLSAARWGSRAASLATSIYTPPPRPPYEEGSIDFTEWLAYWTSAEPRYYDDADRLAQEHLERLATPQPRFREITFNALDFHDLTAALDVYTRVTATRSGLAQQSTVISIAHTISPTRWTTTLGLIEED